MDSLTETTWDIVIAGTSLAQSLIALSLSQSGKQVLHVDRNDYYGGVDAAVSLQEAETWVEQVNCGQNPPFLNAQSRKPSSITEGEASAKLGPARSYTLSLSPHLLYAQSALLPKLVSSRVHTQLEFQAVGPWWLYENGISGSDDTDAAQQGRARLQKIPSSREDLHADSNMSMRDKRGLMKFLRFAVQDSPDDEGSLDQDVKDSSLAELLSSKFSIAPSLHKPLVALSLSYEPATTTPAEQAVARIKRHMRSIGVFGLGFGAILPKYGGGAEIAQVACRASAVGGGVYILGTGITHLKEDMLQTLQNEDERSSEQQLVSVTLSDGSAIRARHVVGSSGDLPKDALGSGNSAIEREPSTLARSISIVSSPLTHLFPPTSDNGPPSAGAVVAIEQEQNDANTPIYLLVHNAESGDCPTGQCIIYASSPSHLHAQSSLATAVDALLQTDPTATVLWRISYEQTGRPLSDTVSPLLAKSASGHVMAFPQPTLDLAFDDRIIESVCAVWECVMGDQAEDADFMRFEERTGMGDGEDA